MNSEYKLILIHGLSLSIECDYGSIIKMTRFANKHRIKVKVAKTSLSTSSLFNFVLVLQI